MASRHFPLSHLLETSGGVRVQRAASEARGNFSAHQGSF